MKANNTTIENALHLAFTPEYVDTFGLTEIAEVWNSNHDTRDFDLNLNAYAEKCTYRMEQDGLTLEFDAWDRLTAEIERFAGVWVLLYCNEVSRNNRPEWLTNSVRNAINTPETSDTMNTETKTMNEESETLARLKNELQEYHDNASKGGADRERNMQWLQEDIKKMEKKATAIPTRPAKTMQEIESQALKLTNRNWRHFNGWSSVNVSETAKALREKRDKLINVAYLNAAAKHLTTKAQAISEFLSVKPMCEVFCVMLDYNSPAVGMALKVASPFCVESLLNDPDKVLALINA